MPQNNESYKSSINYTVLKFKYYLPHVAYLVIYILQRLIDFQFLMLLFCCVIIMLMTCCQNQNHRTL
jgi:hypothetical protein